MKWFMIWQSVSESPLPWARLLAAVVALALGQAGHALAQTNSRYETFRFGVCY